MVYPYGDNQPVFFSPLLRATGSDVCVIVVAGLIANIVAGTDHVDVGTPI